MQHPPRSPLGGTPRKFTDVNGVEWDLFDQDISFGDSGGIMVARYRAKFSLHVLKHATGYAFTFATGSPGCTGEPGKVIVLGERRRAVVMYGKTKFAIFAGEATTLRCHFNGNENEWSVRWIRPGFDQRTIHALAARGFTVAE